MKITTEELLNIIKEELAEAISGKCEAGYKTHETQPTKEMYGKTYRNCVKAEGLNEEEEISEDKICPKGKAWAKRTFDTYPSAYANLAASKYCKDPNYAKDSKKRSKKNESLEEGDLKKWVDQDWVRVTSSGKIAGKCGTSKNKKNPDRCLPRSKAQSMSKSERAATGRKKKAAQKSGKDSGKTSYVSNTKKGKVTKKHTNESKFKSHKMYDPKSGKVIMAKKEEDHLRLAKKGYTHVDPKVLRKVLKDEGGASGMDPFVKAVGKGMEDEIVKTLDAMPDVGQHKDKDYILSDDKEIKVVKERKKNCGCGQDPCKTYGSLTEAEFRKRYEVRHVAEATYDDGSPVEEGFSFIETMNEEELEEAEYRGRKVKLNKPMRGDVKKFKVYVKDPKTGNIKKVNFGHGGSSARKKGEKTMKIRKSNPKARKNFRARHNCDNPGPKTKARYWSCRKW